MKFQAGEVYLNKRTGRHISVLGIYKEDDYKLGLDIMEVDPDTMHTLFPNEITIEKTDLKDWEHVETV